MCEGFHHPALYANELIMSSPSWTRAEVPSEILVSHIWDSSLVHASLAHTCPTGRGLPPHFFHLTSLLLQDPEGFSCASRVRHRQPKTPSRLFLECMEHEAHSRHNVGPCSPQYIVQLSSPVIIATSQTVAIYQDDICLGGAQILGRGPSMYEQQQQQKRALCVEQERRDGGQGLEIRPCSSSRVDRACTA